MTLAITLAVGVTTYALKTEKFSESIERNPIIIGMPASGTSTEPVQIDLGFFKNKISFEGIVDDIDSLDGATPIPSKNELESFVLDNAGSNMTLTVFYENNLGGTNTNTYTVNLLSCSFERIAAQENRWIYKAIFNAGKRTSS